MTSNERDGGGPARRAVMRWAWRLFRKEWRQQVLVLILLTFTVVAAVGLSTAGFVLAPASVNAVFGSASYRYTLDESDPAAVEATVAAAHDWFDQLQVIRRQGVRVAGRSDPVELRAQDPDGAFSEPMLALRGGRYPAERGEVAVAETLAVTLGVGVGDSLDILDEPAVVVGLVENPSNLDDAFILISPQTGVGSDSVTVLAEDSAGRAEAFRGAGDIVPIASSRAAEGRIAALALLSVAELALVLVALIAAAGFVAVAQRRQRQLGMLAAIGATEKHLRLVMVTNGALVGTVSATVGAMLGLVAWFAVAPAVEQTVGQRINAFDAPWWLVSVIMTLTVATTTAAAWWPARVVARVPITRALSGRRPRPRPARRQVGLAAALIVGGFSALAVAGDLTSPTTDGVSLTNALLTASGTIAIIVGVLFLSPMVILILGSIAAPFPLAVRLAFRDLARYQTRSSVALAAIGLALGIPLAVVIAASAAEHGADEGNLSAYQLLITADSDIGSPFVTERTPSEQELLDHEIERIASELDAEAVVELHKVFDPALEVTQFGFETIRVSRPNEEFDGPPVYLATDDLLQVLDLEPVAPGTELITSETGDFAYAGVSGGDPRQDVTGAVTIDTGYSSLPTAMLSAEGLARRGWEAKPAGWLIETSQPVTDANLAAARERAITAGMSIEGRDDQRGLLRLRTAATVIGMGLALGILAMTVGLVRSESGGDLRTLTATGATSSIRRALTASTAAGLVLLGVLLGATGAYLGVTARKLDELATLAPPPLTHLAAIVIGVPAIAALAGWLVSGREPETIARQPIG